MTFRLTRFVAVQVRDWPRAIAFYRDVLGLRLAAGHASEARFEGDSITLFVERLGDDEAAPARHAGRAFFEFETNDFAQARAQLEAAGCKLTQLTSPSGSAMFSDPFGLSFHLYQAGAHLPEIDSVRVECTYRGRVQGVGFRYTARRLAQQWPGLGGSATNESDGSVRLVVQGKVSEVESLLEAIRLHWGDAITSASSVRSPVVDAIDGFTIG